MVLPYTIVNLVLSTLFKYQIGVKISLLRLPNKEEKGEEKFLSPWLTLNSIWCENTGFITESDS